LYAVPFVAVASVPPVSEGAAVTVIVVVLVTLWFLAEVAVIVAVPAVVAVNFADVLVWALKLPPLGHAEPEHVKVTPSPLSFAVATVTVMLWPTSIA
jgi:hypothetical protein